MSATLVGDLSLGVFNPITAGAILGASTNLGAQLTAALSLQASVAVTPPTLAMQLTALLEAAAAIEAGIALGLPGITFSVSAAAALVASIEAQIGLLLILQGFLTETVFVYTYSGGTVSTIGSDLSAALTATPPPGLTGASSAQGILIGAATTSWPLVTGYFGGL